MWSPGQHSQGFLPSWQGQAPQILKHRCEAPVVPPRSLSSLSLGGHAQVRAAGSFTTLFLSLLVLVSLLIQADADLMESNYSRAAWK